MLLCIRTGYDGHPKIGRIRPIRLIQKEPYQLLILINAPADEFPDQRGG
jgi:hypothetical protein